MKKMNQFIKATSLLCILVFCSQAQITSTTSSGSSNQKPQEVVEQARVNQIISESERYFKQGELNIKDGRLPQAWTDLDKSVEVILLSNAKSNSKLSDYYFQLIDQIYQLEMTVKKKTIQKGNLSFTVSPKCLNNKQDDKDTTGLLLKALNLYKRGNYDESLMNLRVVLINEPMSSIAYLLLGKIHLRNGDIEQAVSSLKTALFWDNRLIEAHILLGKIYLERNDRLQSQNYSRSALAIEPNNKRAQALARIVENNYTNEDKKNIENDKLEVEDLLQKASQEKITDVKSSVESVFVAPFQSSENYDLLGEDFAYVLSEVLTAPNLCVVSNEDREKILENFGFDTDETFTLATAIKSAIVSKSSLLIVGQYERTSNNITATTKLIRVNEGRFLSEELPDGRRIIRDVTLSDSLSNLRILQGQIAYQILYQYDKAIPYSQNYFIEKTSKIEIPASLNISNGSNDKIDFSIRNSLKKTICDESVLKNLQLRNFRLGTTFDEAVKLLPKATVKNLNLYEKEMYQSFPDTTLKDLRFKEIHSIVLGFFDNRLYAIGVVYDDNIKWQNINEFASQVQKSLDLPAMKRGGYKFGGNYLYCGNYQIKVMLANNKIPAILLFDTTVFDKIKQRRQEENNKVFQKRIEEEKRRKQIEEEKKKVFKP